MRKFAFLVPWILAALGCAGGGVIAPTDGSDPSPDPQPDPPAPATVEVTVESGSGGGTYEVGAQVPVTAAAAPSGKTFDAWTGDVGTLADPGASQTTLTVPAGGATVTATYRDLPAPSGEVTASVETDPVPGGGDAADDPCLWVHPTDPSKSTVIGTDKSGYYLLVYDLDGNELQRVSAQKVNNVDIRYGFPLGGSSVALVTVSNRTTDSIAAYKVDPATRKLTHVGDVSCGISVYGYCMYKSPDTGSFYGFINSKNGEVEQWRLYDDGSGQVTGERVRTFDVGSIVEGCVADDEFGDFYISEETVGIWKYGAEPGDGASRTKVDSVSSRLGSDVEGLTIYYASDGTGYLIASAQGPSEYVVYEREGDNAYVGKFQITSGAIDGTSNTDGVDVCNAALGSSFPNGVFLAQDGNNSGGNQNFKLVPWERVALYFTPALTIDTAHDPRGGD